MCVCVCVCVRVYTHTTMWEVSNTQYVLCLCPTISTRIGQEFKKGNKVCDGHLEQIWCSFQNNQSLKICKFNRGMGSLSYILIS